MKFYQPLCAAPFKKDEYYSELLPCHTLAPYIRCFWGSEKNKGHASGLVIPDVCADLIFRIWEDRIEAFFIGVSDEPFIGNYTYAHCSTFGIRFYAWTMSLFSGADFSGTKNMVYADNYFFEPFIKEICKKLVTAATLIERKRAAEEVLIKYLCLSRKQIIMQEAAEQILQGKGIIPVHEIAASIHMSSRQLERIFQSETGLSPKKLSSLIRYQALWADILNNDHFSFAQKSIAFGFSDQAHMCREFKKFHGMNIDEAKAYALKDVAFIQDMTSFKH